MFQKYFLCGHKWNSIGEGCRGPSVKAAQLHGSDEGGLWRLTFSLEQILTGSQSSPDKALSSLCREIRFFSLHLSLSLPHLFSSHASFPFFSSPLSPFFWPISGPFRTYSVTELPSLALIFVLVCFEDSLTTQFKLALTFLCSPDLAAMDYGIITPHSVLKNSTIPMFRIILVSILVGI